MRLLSTQITTNEVPKHKIKGKLCCEAQEKRPLRLLSTRTSVNDVAKRTKAKEVKKHMNNDN
jgi:hypothetical protein